MTAIRRVFPESPNLPCLSHIKKNSNFTTQKCFSAGKWTEYIGYWIRVIRMGSVTNFEEDAKNLSENT